MSNVLIAMARGGNLWAGLLAAAVGAVIAGVGFRSFSGAALGAVSGLGVVGLSSLVAALMARLTGVHVDAATAERAVSSSVAATAGAAPAPLASAAGANVETTLPAAAGIASVVEQPTETEAKLMSDGRFAEYHLAKAKRAFAANDHRMALYQTAASLAHGDLPEAATLRAAAKAALR